MGKFLWWMICRIRDQFGDDRDRAWRLSQQLNVIKVSTDDINFGDSLEDPCHASHPTTINRLYCYAIHNDDDSKIPHATLLGSVPAIPVHAV